ncbi:MAG: TatD family hydrolase [Isosphaeraceae bacterium]
MRVLVFMGDFGSVPFLVDTHAHLQDSLFETDLKNVLFRARAEGVVQVIAIGVTAEDSGQVVEMAARNRGVFAAVGVQPNHVAQAGPEDWERIVTLARDSRVVALGETGLDRYWDHAPFPLQQEWFDRHLALSSEVNRPVVIHSRDSVTDIISQLGSLLRPIQGVMHSFTGNWEEALALLELGLHLSFAGMITFTNKKLDALRDVARRMPLDRLLVETDSPYLSPHPHRGQRNEPGRVAFSARRIAEARGITLAELAEATTGNARRLFGLPSDEWLARDS